MSFSSSVRFTQLSAWGSGGRRIALVVIAAVAAGVGLAALPGAAAATPTRLSAAKPVAAKVSSSADLVSAGVSARAQGSRVEVEALRDETSSTWVNPDGTLTTERHQGPIRFRDPSVKGGWRSVDLTMAVNADGTVGPKGHASGLSLAGAGQGADRGAKGAAETDVAGAHEKLGKSKQARDVTLAWAGALGAPVLSGTAATYKDVRPGVDLVVQALRTGFEQNLVITSAQGLASMQGSSTGPLAWQIPVKTKGLTARSEADGSVSFVDKDGVVASHLAAPSAWDAVVDPHSGNHTNLSPVTMSVTQHGNGRATVTLTPDQAWLKDPSRVFPITIDPTYGSGAITTSFDTYVSSAYPTATYSTSTELRVGTYNGGGDVYRSFLTIPITALRGLDVVAANMSLYEFYSWSCTASPFYLYTANGTTASTNWNNQTAPITQWGSTSTAKGYSSSCAGSRVSVPITGLAQSWSKVTTYNDSAIRLSASETDNNGWKKFYSLESSQDPYVSYTYNRKPNAATTPTMVNGVTYNGSTYVAYPSTLIRSTATDPDGSNVQLTYQLSTDPSFGTITASCVTAFVASGANADCTPSPALPDNKTLFVRAAVMDDRSLWNGTWSQSATLKTALTKPSAPSITCTGYPDASWTANAPSADVPCSVTVPSSAAGSNNQPVKIYAYVDGATNPTTIISTGQSAGTFGGISVSKALVGGHTVRVLTQTASTWTSNSTQIGFGWGAASLNAPAAGAASTGLFTVAAAGPPRGTAASVSAKLQWRVAGAPDDTSGWTDGPALTVTPSNPSSATPVAVPNTVWDARTAVRQSGASSDLPTRTPVTLDIQICFNYSGASQCTWSQSPVRVARLPHAFGNGYPTAAAGPGQVALFTGEFNSTASDVSVPGYSGSLVLSRSHSTYTGDGTLANWPSDPATGVFGPGWTAALGAPTTGGASLQVVDNTSLDGTIALIDTDGSALVFQHPTKIRGTYAPGTYLPVTQDTKASGVTLSVAGTGTSTRLTLTDPAGNATVYAPLGVPSTTSQTSWAPDTVSQTGQSGQTTYGRDSLGRVTRIVAAPPAGMPAGSCPTAGTMAAGCRAVDITYASSTTATASAPGDIAGQIQSVTATLWDPTAAAMTTVVVAQYQYDSSKRLVQVTDPRTGLATNYGWDGSSTRLASITPAGQAAFRFTYDASIKLKAVTRDAPTSGGSASTLASYVYGIDPTVDTTGLPQLKGTDVAAWQQNSNPVTGYAVFGQDHPVATTSPAGLTSADWPYAKLKYTDALGYTVNTAAFGAGAWRITSTDYSSVGNVTRTLDETAISTIQAQPGLDPAYISQLSTQTTYTADQLMVTDETGPQRVATLSTGRMTVRPRTHIDYDHLAPQGGTNPNTGQPWRLPTTVTALAVDASGNTVETLSTTTNSYDKLVSTDATEGDGWTLGTPVKVTTGTGGGAITQVTRRDIQGRVTDTRQPLSNGADAGTTKTVYYSYGSTLDTANCVSPAWAGLECRVYPAAAPSSGPSMPDYRVTAYSTWLAPYTTVETSGTATRTTEARFDPAGRPSSTWTVSTIVGSGSRPGTYEHYDPATGMVDYSGNLNPAKTDADPVARTTTQRDLWGRVTSVTNDLGDVTARTYDGAGHVRTVVDAKGTTTYGYDGTDANNQIERRGLPTSLSITRAGAGGSLTFVAGYDEAGRMTIQKLPGAVIQHNTYDEVGQLASLTYSGQVTPVTQTTDSNGNTVYTPGAPQQDQPWLTWSQFRDTAGRVVDEYTPGGAAFDGTPGVSNPADVQAPSVGHALAYDRTYTYDQNGRLTGVNDRTQTVTGSPESPSTSPTVAAPCSVRSYTFDANGRRTQQSVTTHADGDCASTGYAAATTTYAYDEADRATTGANGNGSYAYDAFGRTTTLPAADAPDSTQGDITLGSYDDGLVRTIAQGGMSTTFSLDSAGRRLQADSITNGITTHMVQHYGDTGDNPAWTDDLAGKVTRYASALGGDLGLTISGTDGSAALTLANPHGDIVTTVPLAAAQSSDTAATAISGWSDYTEYGTATSGGSVSSVGGTSGYGWLGAKQRSTTTSSAGLTLMGARLYDSTIGRFTSVDPISGGNANVYTYPGDPINAYDISGRTHTWYYTPRWSWTGWSYTYFSPFECAWIGQWGGGAFMILGLIAALATAGVLGIVFAVASAMAWYFGTAAYFGYGVVVAAEWAHWWGRTGGRSLIWPNGRWYTVWA